MHRVPRERTKHILASRFLGQHLFSVTSEQTILDYSLTITNIPTWLLHCRSLRHRGISHQSAFTMSMYTS